MHNNILLAFNCGIGIQLLGSKAFKLVYIHCIKKHIYLNNDPVGQVDRHGLGISDSSIILHETINHDKSLHEMSSLLAKYIS